MNIFFCNLSSFAVEMFGFHLKGNHNLNRNTRKLDKKCDDRKKTIITES